MSTRLPPAAAQALTVLRWSESEARLVLAAVAASGLTCADFARAHRVSAQRLYVWQRRLASASPAPTPEAVSPLRFVEVSGPAPAPACIEVVAAAGLVVRLVGPVHEEALRTVLRVLRETPPC